MPSQVQAIFLVIAAIIQAVYIQSIDLTTIPTEVCPGAAFNCIADLNDSALRWFFNKTEIAKFTYSEQNPLVTNLTLNTSISGVEIKVLLATANEGVGATFHSLMTVDNIQSLIRDGILLVGCGSLFSNASLRITSDMIGDPGTLNDVQAEPRYDENFVLKEIKIKWMESTVAGNYCTYKFNYTTTIRERDSGAEVDHATVGFAACDNKSCCTTRPAPFLNETYEVCVNATGIIGLSIPVSCYEQTIYGLITGSTFKYSLPFENNSCTTTAVCSANLSDGNCTVRYGQDPSYQVFKDNFSIFHHPFILPLNNNDMYYIEIIFRTRQFGTIFLRTRYTTNGNDTRLKYANIVLSAVMIIGVTMISLIVGIKCYRQIFLSKFSISGCVLFGLVFTLCSLLLVIFGSLTELQEDGCYLRWQHVIAVLLSMIIVAIVISITLLLLSCAIALKKIKKIKLHKSKPVALSESFVCKNTQHNCQKCMVPFGKAKKHHCGKCGEIVCEDCSKAYQKFRGILNQTKLKRICDPCNHNATIIREKVLIEEEKCYLRKVEIAILFRLGIIKIFSPISKDISFSDISEIDSATMRPTMLNCLVIKTSKGDCTYFSLPTANLRCEWINLIRESDYYSGKDKECKLLMTDNNNKFVMIGCEVKTIENTMQEVINDDGTKTPVYKENFKFIVVDNWNKIYIYSSIESTDFIEKHSIVHCTKKSGTNGTDIGVEVKFENSSSETWWFSAESTDKRDKCFNAIEEARNSYNPMIALLTA